MRTIIEDEARGFLERMDNFVVKQGGFIRRQNEPKRARIAPPPADTCRPEQAWLQRHFTDALTIASEPQRVDYFIKVVRDGIDGYMAEWVGRGSNKYCADALKMLLDSGYRPTCPYTNDFCWRA